MYCNQCEQTAKGKACDYLGICEKNEGVAGLQDLLTYAVQGLSHVAAAGRKVGVVDSKVNRFTTEAIFACLTNVDFDPIRFHKLIHEAVQLRDKMRAEVEAAGGSINDSAAAVTFAPANSLPELERQGMDLNFIQSMDDNEDLRSLKQIITYGVRGLAAYTHHAAVLGQEDDAIYAFIHKAMSDIAGPMELGDLVNMALKTGEVNIRAMELLDAGNTGTYGHPVPTEVPLGHVPGKCILVTGHDLKDLAMLLEQTEGTGINIYTHGEMLPCHAYPALKKYSHFYGHFGTAWQNQHKEMPHFPGAILFTTNCIQNPADSYKKNVFTTGMVGWPGVAHVEDTNGSKDFSAVIECALAMDGFTDTVDNGKVMVGFGRNTVLGVADKVIEAVKSRAIRHFFLIGGCDGAKPGRNYFTELAEKVPEDCMILTLACGKFRFFDKQLGDIGGIPRLLDVGQCNDAYSAVQIATALAGAFECGVNDLPLSLVLSWYEQKAVVILLSLFSLGIKNIRLGPSLPAFVTPNVLNVLVENFNIMPISTPAEDLNAILGKDEIKIA